MRCIQFKRHEDVVVKHSRQPKIANPLEVLQLCRTQMASTLHHHSILAVVITFALHVIEYVRKKLKPITASVLYHRHHALICLWLKRTVSKKMSQTLFQAMPSWSGRWYPLRGIALQASNVTCQKRVEGILRGLKQRIVPFGTSTCVPFAKRRVGTYADDLVGLGGMSRMTGVLYDDKDKNTTAAFTTYKD